MARVNLTDRKLRSLAAPSGRETFYDSTLTGFGVRVTATGRKTFVLRYRGHDGRQRRMTLGTYPALSLADARDEARKVLGDLARGEDPAADLAARKDAATFAELAELYMERHAKPRKRSWEYDERMIDRDLLPYWKNRKVTQIRRADVQDVVDRIVDRGSPFAANRVRALVSKIFAFALSRGIVDMNPALGVPRPAKPRSRQRVLTEDEIRRLWKAFEAESPHMGAHFNLRLLTAQRGIEVLSMRWEDVAGDWWTIPAERAKNGLSHRVPLSAQALDVLADLESLADGSEWVFPSPNDDGHLRWVNKAARMIREAVGFEWKSHDLRRTAATFMTGGGTPRLVVGKILNHAEGGDVTSVYDRSSYDLDKRKALTWWGARVAEIVASEAGAGAGRGVASIG